MSCDGDESWPQVIFLHRHRQTDRQTDGWAAVKGHTEEILDECMYCLCRLTSAKDWEVQCRMAQASAGLWGGAGTRNRLTQETCISFYSWEGWEEARYFGGSILGRAAPPHLIC